MLTRRASSLERGDAEGFLQPLAEEARRAEQPIADGADQVPLAGVEFSIAEANQASKTSFPGLELDLVYRYDRLSPDNVFRIPLRYDVERVGGRWEILTSRLAADATLPVWATASIDTATSDHFLALYPPGLDPGPSLSEAEDARSRLEPKLDFSLDTVHLILLARDRAEYESMSAQASPVSAVAQAETIFAISRTRIAAEGRLIVVNLQRIGDSGAVETLQHELGHLALAVHTRPFTPAWVGESAAMYLADTRPTSAWRQGASSGRFDSLSFTQLTPRLSLGQHDASGASASFEYAYSAAAAWYLVETFGAAKFWDFYRSYSEIPAAEVHTRISNPAQGEATESALSQLAVSTTQASLQRVFALTERDLDSRVRAWIGAHIG